MANYLQFEQVKQWLLIVITIARQSTTVFWSVYMYCRLIIFVQIVNNAMTCM